VAEELKTLRASWKSSSSTGAAAREASDLDDEIGKTDRRWPPSPAIIEAAQGAVAANSNGLRRSRPVAGAHSESRQTCQLETTAFNARLENSTGGLRRLRNSRPTASGAWSSWRSKSARKRKSQ